MLSYIAGILQNKGLVGTNWESDVRQRGEMVALYRNYYDGEHRQKLTSEMKKMLQIDSRTDRYNINYCEMVVNTMADRLTVDTIEAKAEGEADAAQQWVADLLRDNRFDGLQIDIRTALLRDGDTFVMTEYDDNAGQTRIFHEKAYDGETGVIVVYDRRMDKLVAGVKIWYEQDEYRANIFYIDAMEKYRLVEKTVDEQGNEIAPEHLEPIGDPIPTSRDSKAPGVPIIAFHNRTKGRGKSELTNVIPLQDSLNRTLHSMVMSSELSAFAILFAKGFKPPAGLTPGMIIHAMIEDPSTGKPMVPETEEEARSIAAILGQFALERIEGGSLDQLIKSADFIIEQIGNVSATPIPSQMGGDSQSGEALKQREVRLIGKCTRAQVQMGNSFEDMAGMAHAIETLYTKTNKPPAITGYNCRWKSAEVRADADILAAATFMFDRGFTREGLRVLSQSSLFNYDEEAIDKLMLEYNNDVAARLGSLSASPDFNEMQI